jgi:hypothetical protein
MSISLPYLETEAWGRPRYDIDILEKALNKITWRQLVLILQLNDWMRKGTT